MAKQYDRKRTKAAAYLLWLLLWITAAEAVAGGSEVSETERTNTVFQAEQTVPDPLEQLSLYAQAAVLMDADSGRVLYEKNGFTPMAMASTTKIMTCITALEYGNPDEEAEVSAYAASMPKVKLYVKQGEAYQIRDLLYSLMLESHNDSAVVIAEHIGRKILAAQQKKAEENMAEQHLSAEAVREAEALQDADSKEAVAAFISLMNRKAEELGCENTWFITPNGLDATETFRTEDGGELIKEHSTTAAELARMMAYCIDESPQAQVFLEITRTSAYSFTANGRTFGCTNHNAFLNMMDGALSGKTGFTNKAGYCYVGALKQGEETYTVALLACGWPNNKTYKWSDTRALMQYGLNHYEYHTFRELAEEKAAESTVNEQLLTPIPVTGGCTELLGTTACTRLTVGELPEGGILLREDEKLAVSCELPGELTAPIKAGTVVGNVFYRLGETVCVQIPVMTADAIAEITFSWCMEQILARFAVAL